MIPENFKFTKSHEWASLDEAAGVVTIGISEFAVQQLGDIVFLELPAVGDNVTQGQPFGVVESVKAAVDLDSPISGDIVEVNEDLLDNFESLTSDPYNQAWMIRVKIDDKSQLDSLMSAPDYETFIQNQ